MGVTTGGYRGSYIIFFMDKAAIVTSIATLICIYMKMTHHEHNRRTNNKYDKRPRRI